MWVIYLRDIVLFGRRCVFLFGVFVLRPEGAGRRSRHIQAVGRSDGACLWSQSPVTAGDRAMCRSPYEKANNGGIKFNESPSVSRVRTHGPCSRAAFVLLVLLVFCIVKTCTVMRKGQELNMRIGSKSLHHFVQRLLVPSVRMEKVRPWCGQPSDRGRLKNKTESLLHTELRMYDSLSFELPKPSKRTFKRTLMTGHSVRLPVAKRLPPS